MFGGSSPGSVAAFDLGRGAPEIILASQAEFAAQYRECIACMAKLTTAARLRAWTRMP